MAESKRCGRPDNTNGKTIDNLTNEKAAAEYRQRRFSNGYNEAPADEDSDNECWDDAKALLHNDNLDEERDHAEPADNGVCDKFCDELDGVKLKASSGRDQYKHKLAAPCDTVDGQVSTVKHRAGSSSAYFSTNQSNNVTASAAPVAETYLPATSNNTSSAPDDLILHEAVFNNDTEKILTILNDAELVKRDDLVNKRDKHGNTALHLACMLGRSQDIISAFLNNKHGFKWSIDAKNVNRWTPFHEACSYGNREVITLLAKQLKDDVDDALNNSKLSDFLAKTRDYRLVLKWEFQSWVPFVSRVLPSDVCVIIKQGKFVRLDTRLLDFEGLFKRKGDSCLVYSDKKWIVMDNKAKKYQFFETPNVCKDIDVKVDEFMATDIMDLELKSSEMQLTRSTSGWIWKADKVGKVGRFNAALYDLNNVFLVTRKRREHLSEDDLKRNKNAYKSAVHVFKFGEKPSQPRAAINQADGNDSSAEGPGGDEEGGDEDEDEEEIIHRDSLPPPEPTNVTWQQYLRSEPGNHPTLGREQRCKLVKTAVKASVAVSEEFPLSKHEFLDLLSIVPIKMFKKLKEFVEMKLPDGFPVRLDIPVFPFLTARITFEDFAFHDGPIDESLFTVPQDYELDANLLPARLRGNNNNDGENNPNTNDGL